MAMPKTEKKPEGAEDWLTTYADAITLLMAFFVMMLTFAEFDVPAYQEAAAAIANNIGAGEKDNVSDTQELKIDVEDVVFEMQAAEAVDVKLDKKGVVIELSGGAFFKPGTAKMYEDAIPVLDKITKMIAAPKFQFYNIEVGGHSDDSPIQTEQFPSNWELSGARASTVVRFFEVQEIDKKRMRAIGFADIDPKVPNLDKEGQPIPENRATNRRITIRVYPMNLSERDKYGKKVDLKGALSSVGKKPEAAQ
jgi:chemotaxis protein MotB